MSQRSVASSSIEDKQSSQSGSSQPVITDSSSSVPISSGYSTEGTGSSTQGGQSMEVHQPSIEGMDPIVVEAGETVVYSIQRTVVSSQSQSSEYSSSSKARKSQRPKKSASATSLSSQESVPSQPSRPSQASQESQFSRRQTSTQSSQVVEIPVDDAPREESEEDDEEMAVETNVEPSTSGKEVINKQSYVVTMNDQSELMPTEESQPRTQTVIKKAKSQKKGKAKIDVKKVTGMDQEGSSQEQETQEPETQEQGDAFTLELDEDPLGNSEMFVAEDTTEEMETEASNTTPASTKRKGKPKKLSSAKTSSPVVKKKPGRSKQAKGDVSGSKQKKPKAASTGKKKAGTVKQKGSEIPATPVGATADEPTVEDTKRMPPKQRRARRRITMPTSTSTPAGKEQVAVFECTTSGELPSVEPTATVEDEDWTLEFEEDSAMSKSSSKQSPSVRTPWEIAEKRMLVAEAKQWGIRPTARRHNMSFSTLRVWMGQDFGDMPGTKKRLPGGGRPLKYDQSVDLELKEWVLQKMAMNEKVTHTQLRDKSMELILPHNPNFLCSQGWITRFLYRHEINLKTKVIGKDAHPFKDKDFGTPSPSKSRKRTPRSADKAALHDTPVSAPLGKRKAATTSPAGRRKRPRREASEKSDLSIFDFED